ncbi:MAG: ABC transporter permease, partial [Bacteroidota bacterium]
MIEFFIAKRYLKAKRRMNFITIISLLSTIGITIGVAALVIVLSVFNGFGSVVTSIMVSFDPHIRISVIDEKGFAKISSVENVLIQTKDITGYYPFVDGKAILLNRKNYE